MTPRSNGPGRRRPLLVVAVLGALLAAAAWALASLGNFLVVRDALERSDAIVVVQGGTPVRELRAAELYRDGLAPVVVVARAWDSMREARRLAGEPTLQERSVRALQHLGVPSEAIVRLTHEVDNTARELDVVFHHARAAGFRRVILVTSPDHTRRVRVIWSVRYEGTLPALVTPTPYEPFDAARWWASRTTLEHAVHELFGIANFLLGSPLPSHAGR